MTGKSPASEADRRVEHLVHNTGALRKSLKDRNEDVAGRVHLQIRKQRGDLIQLDFSPNPQFKPPSHEAQVFHAMTGNIWVDGKQSRVEEVRGDLTQAVKFGGGLL